MTEDSITVDPGLLDENDISPGPGNGANTTVWVVTPDADRAAIALHRAGRRFMRVTTDGVEQPDDDEHFERLALERQDLDWPSWVSGVYATDEGPALVMDWESGAWPEARPTMTAILIEELRAEGVTRAHLRPLAFHLKDLFGGTPILPPP